MELTNKERVCFGLNEVKDNWIKKEISNNYFIYIENNILVKRISFTDNSYYESDVSYELNEDNTLILPKTQKGKPKKLTESNIRNLYQGVYLSYSDESIRIGNGYNEISYYSSSIASVEIKSLKEFKEWVTEWVNNTNSEEQCKINEFKNAKRKHCKFKEGDYFRVKLDRNLYGYGRILMNIDKRRKEGMEYWEVLMGKPLIIELFHIVTDNKNINIDDLKKLKTFPSQHIMDNVFFYGEYEIIGNDKLPDKLAFPIMYGRSISANDLNKIKIFFQCGEIHKYIPYTDEQLIKKKDFPNYPNNFINNGIGFNINNNLEVMNRCIKEQSNKYYWEYFKHYSYKDLRSPMNKEVLVEVLKQFNLLELLEIYKNSYE